MFVCVCVRGGELRERWRDDKNETKQKQAYNYIHRNKYIVYTCIIIIFTQIDRLKDITIEA